MKRTRAREPRSTKGRAAELPFLCSLVDHIQDEDHPLVQQSLNRVDNDAKRLAPGLKQFVRGLVETLRAHIKYEREFLFPVIREWARNGKVAASQKRRIKKILRSNFGHDLNLALEELRDVQEHLDNEKIITDIDRLEEKLFIYARSENQILLPIVSRQLGWNTAAKI